MLQAKLVVVAGDTKTKEVALKLPAIIGRGREATLTVPHALISRLHCQITEREGRLFVKDLGSLNGTFIDNFRIDDEHPLLPDQLLTLGTITFRACYEIDHAEVPGQPSQEGRAVNRAAPVPAMASVRTDTWQAGPEADTPASINAIPFSPTPPAAAVVHHPLAVSAAAPPAPLESPASPQEVAPRIQIATEIPRSAEKSICLESLHELPNADPGLSFDSALQLGSEVSPPLEDASSIHVAGAEPQPAAVDAAESELRSFIRKLPR